MREQLAKIRAEALAAFESVQDAARLDELRVKYLGKKGELTALLKQMGRLTPEERPVMGQLANDVRSSLEQAIEAQSGVLSRKALEARLAAAKRSRSRSWQTRALMTRTPAAFSRRMRTTVSTASWARAYRGMPRRVTSQMEKNVAEQTPS